MKNNIAVFLLSLALSLTTANIFAQCSPTTTSGSCGSVQSLTVGASCVTGTTCGGGPSDPAGSCLASGAECSWYSFTASANDMFVEIDVTYTDGCHIRSSVYSGSCGSLTEISCESGAPLDDMHSLSGLTIGNTYYIQVCYSPGGPCGKDGFADYCIRTGEPDPPCAVCSSPCGTASGYATSPTTQQVVDDCQTSPFSPELQPSSTHTFCYSFTATATSVDFNVIITSDCGSGNVSGFSWDLYNYPSCGGAIQSGTLSSLTFSGLTIGNDYVFCYTFTVPSTCTHSQHCPYFVGAEPLPISLVSFDAEALEDKSVNLKWITESEINNDFFTIERSKDGESFEVVDILEGAGNSSEMRRYNMEDENPYTGTSYYRLKQTDYDGKYSYSDIQSVEINKSFGNITVFPNPVKRNGTLSFDSGTPGKVQIEVYDLSGRLVLEDTYSTKKGMNSLELNTESLKDGMYFLLLDNEVEKTTVKFIKE